MPYNQAAYNHEVAYLQAWQNEAKTSGRKLGLWLYPCFPNEDAVDGGFNEFPGYYANTLGAEFDLFGNSFSTIWACGWGQEVDSYVTLKLLEDSSQNVSTLVNNYFTHIYGPAASSMQAIYNLIENAYANPANYPPDVATSPTPMHQTEGLAWGWLGNAGVVGATPVVYELGGYRGGEQQRRRHERQLVPTRHVELHAGRTRSFLAGYASPAISLTGPANNAVYDQGARSRFRPRPRPRPPVTACTRSTPARSSTGWHFIEATHDAATDQMQLFVDGVLQGTQPYTPTTCAIRRWTSAAFITSILKLNSGSWETGSPATWMKCSCRRWFAMRSPTIAWPKAARRLRTPTRRSCCISIPSLKSRARPPTAPVAGGWEMGRRRGIRRLERGLCSPPRLHRPGRHDASLGLLRRIDQRQ